MDDLKQPAPHSSTDLTSAPAAGGTTSTNPALEPVVSVSTPHLEPAPQPASSAQIAIRPRRHSGFREYAESFLVTVLLALFGTSFVVQAFKIPSPSMEPTLLVGDHLLVNKFVFGGAGAWYERILPYRPIHRADIIVFKYPYEDHPHYVKRVIGLPGDHLRIVNKQVYINGKPLREPYAVFDRFSHEPFADNFPPTSELYVIPSDARGDWLREVIHHVDSGDLVIPKGRFFVMGDNRDRSADSRYWGFVPRDAIMGRPFLVYWSVDADSDDYSDRSFTGRISGLADFLLHLPAKTRWHRMFRTLD